MQVSLTSNGSSAVKRHHGGPLYVQTLGDYSSGTLTVELDLGSGFVAEYSMTAPESRRFDFPVGDVRFTLAGATAPTIDIEVR
ncbi:MAG: hypothetical protein Aurels2KO_10510 [Aureliella sp.]